MNQSKMWTLRGIFMCIKKTFCTSVEPNSNPDLPTVVSDLETGLYYKQNATVGKSQTTVGKRKNAVHNISQEECKDEYNNTDSYIIDMHHYNPQCYNGHHDDDDDDDDGGDD
jgi:hypothetical protein